MVKVAHIYPHHLLSHATGSEDAALDILLSKTMVAKLINVTVEAKPLVISGPEVTLGDMLRRGLP